MHISRRYLKEKHTQKVIHITYTIGIILTLITSCSTIPVHIFEDNMYVPNIDYEEEQSWFVLNDMPDNIPNSLKRLTENDQILSRLINDVGHLADVFFIHPTTYFSNLSWNQDPIKLHGIAGISSIYEVLWKSFQASVFSECCNIFSPRYRQVTYGAFSDNNSGLLARELAFSDIMSSFDYYMENYHSGKPIIISGHSQGSELAMRLIYEKFNDKEMAKKLLVAYIPGFPFSRNDIYETIPNVPICSSKTQISCINTWMTLGDNPDTVIFHEQFTYNDIRYKLGDWISISGKELICVNPLSWKQDVKRVEGSYNPGSYIPNIPEFMSLLIWEYASTEILRGFASAQCEDGFLVTDAPRNRLMVSDSDYHRYDIPLFYFSIRENVLDRLDTYYAAEARSDLRENS